jgi:Zn-dependent metalloprotease
MKRLAAVVLVLVLAPSAHAALLRGDLGAARGSATHVAQAALARYAHRLGVHATSFRFTSVRHSKIGTHVRGAQFVDGVKVDGSDAIVSVIAGRVVWVAADQVRAAGRPVAHPISARAAQASALGRLGVSLPQRVHAERLLTARGDVYRVAVFSLHPAIARTVDVSATTGRIVAIRDDNRYDDAVGTVFDPNPIVTSHNTDLRETGDTGTGADADLDSAELDAQLKDRPVRGYDPQLALAGKLSGPWVNAQSPAPFVQVTPGRFDINRGMPQFEALMSYVHIDRYQRYLQDVLGFKNVNNESQDLYALPVEGYDNSFYQPGNDIIVLGAGGVDDGEDAEVFLHEYGHAVQDAQVPGWGAQEEGGAMGEGFGDFQAATYYAKTSGGFQDACLMEWDSTSYSTSNPTCIRRMDNTKRYPKDVDGEVHDDGEIWSQFLWRIRNQLGATADEMSDNALKLVLSSHELLTPNAKFRDAVLALKTAAHALGHDEWIPIIVDSATITGFPTK